jgi:hypothetical protein
MTICAAAAVAARVRVTLVDLRAVHTVVITSALAGVAIIPVIACPTVLAWLRIALIYVFFARLTIEPHSTGAHPLPIIVATDATVVAWTRCTWWYPLQTDCAAIASNAGAHI